MSNPKHTDKLQHLNELKEKAKLGCGIDAKVYGNPKNNHGDIP
jgi:hypothetical protein